MGTAIIRLRSAHRGRTATSSAASGSIRCESLDHIIVFDEAQVRRVLKKYASYYDQVRTHLSLDKNAPMHRPSGASATMRLAAGRRAPARAL